MHKVITEHIEKALKTLGVEDAPFSIEHPAVVEHGDYATNAALVVSKVSGKNPRKFAEELRNTLNGSVPNIDSIEIAGPGFINFKLSRNYFSDQVKKISDGVFDFDLKTLNSESKTVLVEYTSPNLFKPLHIGNLVGNIVGESLARLSSLYGAKVHRINYPSDVGLTVAKAVWGILNSKGDPENIAALGEAYKQGTEAYDANESARLEIENINKAIYERSDDKIVNLWKKGRETSLKHLDVLCKILGTSFDNVIFESEASKEGLPLVVSNTPAVFEKSDGAIVYKGEQKGLHTRVFVNSKGLPTYEAKDLGNFYLKQKLYPDWNIITIVTGNEQMEYFKVLFAALRDVFKISEQKELEHISTGFLTLTTGKMSSRKGNVLTGESLLEELAEESRRRARETRSKDVEVLSRQIAVAALKYQILRQQVGRNIVFDKKQAFSFEGDSGPYLQYTLARILSVLDAASVVGIVTSTNNPPSDVYDIERIMYQYGEIVDRSFIDRSPHHIVSYLSALCGAFNSLYGNERFTDVSDVHAPYRCAIANGVGNILKSGLWLLGIEAPERM